MAQNSKEQHKDYLMLYKLKLLVRSGPIEKDELTYALGTAEHSGRTRGLGRNISREHGFPNDRDTYRSQQRSKDGEAARINRLEEYVRESREALRQAQEREKDMQARMQRKS